MRQQFNSLIRQRSGLSLAELIVVLVIMTLLIAISVPALHGARNRARRWNCANQLRQVGIGIANYHHTLGLFPFGWQCDSNDPFYEAGPEDYMWSGWSQLLPQLEATATFNAINFDLDVDFLANRTAIGQTLSQFVCPDSGNDLAMPFGSGILGQLDYAMNSGYLQSPKSGIMFRNSDISMESVSDGLSHTFMVGEVTANRSPSSQLRPWSFASNACSLTADDSARPFELESQLPVGWGSQHVHGSHFLLCDGSVRFLSDQTPASILKALSTRQHHDHIVP